MVHYYHKTCTEWSPTRLYNPHPAIKLQSRPKYSSTTSTSSTPSSSATLTPTSPSPSTTPPPKTILDTAILSTSPPSLFPSTSRDDDDEDNGQNPTALTLPHLDALHATHPLTHLPCPHPDEHEHEHEHHHHHPSSPSSPHVDGKPLTFHADAILVSCASSYRRGPAPHLPPAAAAAVHFSATSPLNAVYGFGADGAPLTRERADLLAGIKALERVGEFVRAAEEARRSDGGGGGRGGKRRRGLLLRRGGYGDGGEDGDDDDDDEEAEEGVLSQVVIRSHSQYLVRGATELLGRWKGRGWANSRGKVVANVDLFWYLDRRITWLEWMGVEVLWLLVGREENAGAVGLVGKGL